MNHMREWLDHRRFEPSTFRYTFEPAGFVFKSVFTIEAEAIAFATEFGGRVMPASRASAMGELTDHLFGDPRTLEQALADLRTRYARNPAPDLAHMIRHGEAEMLDRLNESSSLATDPVAVTECEKPDREKRL
jgi:hypothetical protein